MVNMTNIVYALKVLTAWWGREKGNQVILIKSEKCPDGGKSQDLLKHRERHKI